MKTTGAKKKEHSQRFCGIIIWVLEDFRERKGTCEPWFGTDNLEFGTKEIKDLNWKRKRKQRAFQAEIQLGQRHGEGGGCIICCPNQHT